MNKNRRQDEELRAIEREADTARRIIRRQNEELRTIEREADRIRRQQMRDIPDKYEIETEFAIKFLTEKEEHKTHF